MYQTLPVNWLNSLDTDTMYRASNSDDFMWIIPRLSNDKTFVCPKCHLSVDRDIAGARNNFFAAYGNAVGIGWDGISN
jgi:hypothetical protein